MQPTRSAALLAAILLASAPLAAQTSDAQARDEIAFARGLAAEWGFVDLAQEVIADLEQAGVSKKVAEEVALAKCAVYYEGAKADRARRGELLEQALTAYRDFVASHSYSELLPQAELELIGVTSYYSRYISSELGDAVGEEAEALRAKLAAVLDVAVEKTGELIGGLQAVPEADRSEAERRSLYELLFNRGEMMLELAKSQEDGTYSFEASFRAFETLFDEAGEGSPWGLRALIGIGDNLMAQGDPGEASSYYEFVVETAIPRDLAAWERAKDEQEMSLEEIEQRFLFVQMASGGLVESLSAAGKTEAAAAWGLHYYDVWKREGLELVQPMGHLSLLSVARTLVDAG